MYVLVRLTSFMDDAGYHEASIAVWQATIDFLHSRPQLSDKSKALASFETYWESEVARLGEDNWVTWADYREGAPLPEPVAVQSRSVEEPAPDLVERFVQAERQTQEDLQFPGRTIDDAGEDDPFHVVLFSDLQPVLSTLYSVSNTELCIVTAFLCYSGLPPLPTSSEGTRIWWLDPFLKHPRYDSRDGASTSGASFPASRRYSKVTTASLFGGVMDVNLGARKQWISNILKVFVQWFPHDDNLCEYYIAFRMKQFGSS
jgi:hypothetical protein